MELAFHEIAEIFPVDPAEVEKLKAKIAKFGQIDPILTYQGQIVIGRHCYLACQAVGIEPEIREWTGAEHMLLDLVIEPKRQRTKTLSKSQLAMAAAPRPELRAGRPGGNP